jgi:tRNA/rRNA methyltransferase
MTRFILLHTSHGGNVGAAARAMKVMGFSDLVLVAPRFADVLTREDTLAFASGAQDVLEQARIVETLAEAVDGVDRLVATAMTPRDFGPVSRAPREAFSAWAPEERRTAFLFGSERFGMSNAEVWACHEVVTIPTLADYGSLNLAQAVQVIAYEWRQALGGFEIAQVPREPSWADAASIQGVLGHWREALTACGYLDPAAPKKLMPRMNQLLNRLNLTQEEVHILRGVARAVLKSSCPSAADGAKNESAASPERI